MVCWMLAGCQPFLEATRRGATLVGEEVPIAVDGDADGGMAKLGRDVLQVLALLDEHAREEVSQRVDPDVAQVRAPEGWSPDASPQIVGVDWPASGGGEHHRLGRWWRLAVLGAPPCRERAEQLIPDIDRPTCSPSLRQVVLRTPNGASDKDAPPGGINVAPLQGQELAQARSRIDGRRKKRRPFGLTGLEELIDL